jgi:hypothetical protein
MLDHNERMTTADESLVVEMSGNNQTTRRRLATLQYFS